MLNLSINSWEYSYANTLSPRKRANTETDTNDMKCLYAKFSLLAHCAEVEVISRILRKLKEGKIF